MTFKPIPYGANLVKYNFDQLKSFYQSSTANEGYCGCMERTDNQIRGRHAESEDKAGKQILINPAELEFVTLCIAIVFNELRECLLSSLYSRGFAPYERVSRSYSDAVETAAERVQNLSGRIPTAEADDTRTL